MCRVGRQAGRQAGREGRGAQREQLHPQKGSNSLIPITNNLTHVFEKMGFSF
jgi:hypothetical protein